MMSSARLKWIVALPALAGVCAGCVNGNGRAREQAERRWDLARASVKARLAADKLDDGNVAEAADALAEAQRLDPDNPALVPLCVKVWLAEGNLGAADALLEQQRVAGPPRAELSYLRGVVRQQQQRWDEALTAFAEAAQLDARQVAYVVAHCHLLLQLGRADEALQSLIERETEFGWTNAYQAAAAECYEQLGNWDAAAAAWRKVTSATETEADIRERLAVALFRAQRFPDAIQELRSICDTPSGGDDHTALRLMLVEALLNVGQTDAARAALDPALQLHPHDAGCQRMLACCEAASGQYELAYKTLVNALVTAPADGTTLELAAALALRAGHRSDAEQYALRLLGTDARNAVAKAILSRLGERAK